jgi:hypothetical protein
MYVLISISILCDKWVCFVQENLSSQQETVKEDEEHHSVTVLCASNEVYAVSQVKETIRNFFYKVISVDRICVLVVEVLV